MDSVLNFIPHRPPFLFVDRIVQMRPEGLTAERKLLADESFFAGHYPGQPIMPGVLMCESIFQAAAIYLSQLWADQGHDIKSKVPVLAKIEEARFKRIVKPGETMVIDVTWRETLGQFTFMQGSIKVDGQLAVSVRFALSTLEAPTSLTA